MTTSCAPLVRWWIGKAQAREYLGRRGILTHQAFDKVDWASVESSLNGSSQLYRLWWAKHVSKKQVRDKLAKLGFKADKKTRFEKK